METIVVIGIVGLATLWAARSLGRWLAPKPAAQSCGPACTGCELKPLATDCRLEPTPRRVEATADRPDTSGTDQQ